MPTQDLQARLDGEAVALRRELNARYLATRQRISDRTDGARRELTAPERQLADRYVSAVRIGDFPSAASVLPRSDQASALKIRRAADLAVFDYAVSLVRVDQQEQRAIGLGDSLVVVNNAPVEADTARLMRDACEKFIFDVAVTHVGRGNPAAATSTLDNVNDPVRRQKLDKGLNGARLRQAVELRIVERHEDAAQMVATVTEGERDAVSRYVQDEATADRQGLIPLDAAKLDRLRQVRDAQSPSVQALMDRVANTTLVAIDKSVRGFAEPELAQSAGRSEAERQGVPADAGIIIVDAFVRSATLQPPSPDFG